MNKIYLPLCRKVCVVGDALSVEAKHEEKSDNKFVSRQFSRKYTLPKGCDASMVSSNLSSDGILASDLVYECKLILPKTKTCVRYPIHYQQY